MPTVITTVGAATANSYVSEADADTYHTLHIAAYVTDWTGAIPTTKQEAVILATRLLDAMYEWAGYAVDDVQALGFPRSDLLTRNGFALDYESIPVELENATAEFARQLITSNRAADSEIDAQGITDLKAGPVALSFKDFVPPKVVPDAVIHLIPREWGSPRGRKVSVRTLLRA